MGKIRLEIEALEVESFAPIDAPTQRGTVHGMASLYWEDCLPDETHDGAWTCGPTEQSCNGTCYENTCHPGCGGGGPVGSGWSCPMAPTCEEQIITVNTPDC
jgi:hypothetical protein